MLSRHGGTIDGGNRIYWTLYATEDHTSQITITHRPVFSVTDFTALLGSGFQQCSVLDFRVQRRLASLHLLSWTNWLHRSKSDRWSVSQSVLVSSTRFLLLSVAGLLIWDALSNERTGLSFKIAAGLRQRSYSRIRVPRDSWPYFPVSDSRLPNLEG
jgi:hypothetical protein